MTLQLSMLSFGRKNGGVDRSEYSRVFNATKVPNPPKSLRKYKGTHKEIQRFLECNEKSKSLLEEFIRETRELIKEHLEKCEEREVTELDVAVFCEYGKHRSVGFCELMANEFKEDDNVEVVVKHRDVSLNSSSKGGKNRRKKKDFKKRSFNKRNQNVHSDY